MIKKLKYLAILFFFIPLFSLAGISVSNMLMNLTPPNINFKNLKVTNLSKTHKAYVAVTIQKIIHPGTANQKKINYTTQSPFQFGLAVAPNKLIIPPGQSRTVRFVALGPKPKIDRSYIVTFTPKEGTIESVKYPGHSKATIGLNIIEAFAVRTFIRPLNQKPEIKLIRHKKSLFIQNIGKTNGLIVYLRQCKTIKTPFKLCKIIGYQRRMYAGNTWKIKLKKALPIKAFVQYNNHYFVSSSD